MYRQWWPSDAIKKLNSSSDGQKQDTVLQGRVATFKIIILNPKIRFKKINFYRIIFKISKQGARRNAQMRVACASHYARRNTVSGLHSTHSKWFMNEDICEQVINENIDKFLNQT